MSSDIIGIRYGSLFDATQTMVTKIDDDTYQVQVVSWYDNENSYTSQMVRSASNTSLSCNFLRSGYDTRAVLHAGAFLCRCGGACLFGF